MGYLFVDYRENARKTLAEARFFDSAGQETGLEAFHGKVVLVNLWATWCTPCIAELPSLEELQVKYGDQGLQVLPVALDRDKDAAAAEAFMREKNIMRLSSLHDKNRAVMGKWGYEGVPTSILLDRKGGIIKVFEGPFIWDKGEPLEAVKAALAER
ncbi:MAG: TlpA disulfide reductase family protein [Alphaproteobacteria bacterium]